AEKDGSRPVHPGNEAGDLSQRTVTLTLILEPVLEDDDGVRAPVPLANELGAGFQDRAGVEMRGAFGLEFFGESVQAPLGCEPQPPMRAFLNSVGDRAQ